MKSFRTRFAVSGVAAAALLSSLAAAAPKVELKRDDARGQLQVLIDGNEAIVYQYGKQCDQVHCYPVRSPSGKLLTVQQDDPYPHHRSFWFGDTVQLAGQGKASFYSPFYSKIDKKDPNSPYRDQTVHVKFLKEEVNSGSAALAMQLLWVTDAGKTPVMDDVREMRIVPLGKGEYFLDCRFRATAAYGEVTFLSDQVHYAWPYFRMHPQFAVEPKKPQKGAGPKGKDKTVVEPGTGTITNSEGKTGGQGTCMRPARWVDYSGKVDGVTEGLALFADPQQPPPKFFTRDYGTFGPRRPDAQSGRPFVLKKGESLRQRVGVLVHAGDVQAGRVAERYRQFAEGKL